MVPIPEFSEVTQDGAQDGVKLLREIVKSRLHTALRAGRKRSVEDEAASMLDVRLKKTEKSEIFVLVQQSGMNPADFKWTDEESTECASIEAVRFRISVLTHHPTEYFCKFAGYWTQFSPGHKERVQSQKTPRQLVREA